MTEKPNRAESLLSEMSELIASELAARGIASPGELAAACVGRLAKALGGCQFYLPKGAGLDRHLRDVQIRASHDGTVDGPRGVTALARQHGLTEICVWRVLAKQRITNAR